MTTALHKMTALLATGLVTAFVASTELAAAAATTQQSQVSYHDGRGDVWRADLKTEQSVRLHHYPRADELGATMRRTATAITVRVRFADLQPVGTHLFWLHLRTRDHQWDAVVTSKPGHRAGQLYFQGDDGAKSCAGFTRSISYTKDRVKMRIPSTCIHDARWVRLGFFNQLSYSQKGPNYYDNPTSHRQFGPQTPRLFEPTA